MAVVRTIRTKSVSIFSRIPNGKVFYKNDGTGPFVKIGRNSVLATNSDPIASPAGTAFGDVSSRVEPVRKFSAHSQRLV